MRDSTAMRMFHTHPKPGNLLPCDGEVIYLGAVLSEGECSYYFEKMMTEIDWKNDEAVLFGKKIITKRKAAWYADKKYAYTYSNSTKHALPWTYDLLTLKAIVERKSSATFNSVLLNLYHNGEEGMAWHSDDEKTLQNNGVIVSLSLGAERKFSFNHKNTGETVSLVLGNGSLLVMKGSTQKNWLHRLPPTKKIDQPRVNLTFRTVVEQ
jgi:alkylated DNA repair dioxygenase AlkB